MTNETADRRRATLVVSVAGERGLADVATLPGTIDEAWHLVHSTGLRLTVTFAYRPAAL